MTPLYRGMAFALLLELIAVLMVWTVILHGFDW